MVISGRIWTWEEFAMDDRIVKWKNIMDTTLKNYSNMITRLSRRSKISNLILIYYSLSLIVYSITNKFFPDEFDTNLSEYFSILLSIIVLVYSIINNNANYTIRISKIQDSLNQLKTLKREIKDEISEEDFKKLKPKYYEITDKTERRELTDFFKSIKEYCREYGINWVKFKPKEIMTTQEDAVNKHLSEVNKYVEQMKIIFEYCWNMILFLIPIAIFCFCFLNN